MERPFLCEANLPLIADYITDLEQEVKNLREIWGHNSASIQKGIDRERHLEQRLAAAAKVIEAAKKMMVSVRAGMAVWVPSEPEPVSGWWADLVAALEVWEGTDADQ